MSLHRIAGRVAVVDHSAITLKGLIDSGKKLLTINKKLTVEDVGDLKEKLEVMTDDLMHLVGPWMTDMDIRENFLIYRDAAIMAKNGANATYSEGESGEEVDQPQVAEILKELVSYAEEFLIVFNDSLKYHKDTEVKLNELLKIVSGHIKSIAKFRQQNPDMADGKELAIGFDKLKSGIENVKSLRNSAKKEAIKHVKEIEEELKAETDDAHSQYYKIVIISDGMEQAIQLMLDSDVNSLRDAAKGLSTTTQDEFDDKAAAYEAGFNL